MLPFYPPPKHAPPPFSYQQKNKNLHKKYIQTLKPITESKKDPAGLKDRNLSTWELLENHLTLHGPIF